MAAPAFEAFTSEPVVQQFSRKIECLCSWGNVLLVGLNDGSLLVFGEELKEVRCEKWVWPMWSA
jgi:hypothetical protein